METNSGFWADLMGHMASIGTIAGFVGILLAAYQVWVPAPVIERNHARVTAIAQWASRGSWLDLMQNGVLWVLVQMHRLYGPPRQGAQSFIVENLTVRAWKMSAWIAALLLLVFPPLFFAVAIPTTEFIDGRTVTWEAIPSFGGIAIVLATPFLMTWRTIRRKDEFTDHSGIEKIGSAATAIVVEGTKPELW
jgi:hypothetical protein